jgi:hypothetical protein
MASMCVGFAALSTGSPRPSRRHQKLYKGDRQIDLNLIKR